MLRLSKSGVNVILKVLLFLCLRFSILSFTLHFIFYYFPYSKKVFNFFKYLFPALLCLFTSIFVTLKSTTCFYIYMYKVLQKWMWNILTITYVLCLFIPFQYKLCMTKYLMCFTVHSSVFLVLKILKQLEKTRKKLYFLEADRKPYSMLIRGKFMKIPLSTKQSAGYSSLDSSERGWLNSNEDYALSHGSSVSTVARGYDI